MLRDIPFIFDFKNKTQSAMTVVMLLAMMNRFRRSTVKVTVSKHYTNENRCTVWLTCSDFLLLENRYCKIKVNPIEIITAKAK